MKGTDSLINHYKTNFQLMQHHNYSLYDLDHMLPYEREIYISLLLQYLQEEKAAVITKLKKENAQWQRREVN